MPDYNYGQWRKWRCNIVHWCALGTSMYSRGDSELLPHFQTFHILNVLLKSPPKTVRNIKMFSYVKKKKERRKGGRKEKRFILGPPSLSTYCCCSCSVMSDSLWPIGLQLYRLLCVFQSRILEWLPFPSRGDLASLGIRPESLALQVDSLLAEPSGKLLLHPRAEKVMWFVCSVKWPFPAVTILI